MYTGTITTGDPDLINSYDIHNGLKVFYLYDRHAESPLNEWTFGRYASVDYHGLADHLVGSGTMPDGLTEALSRWSWRTQKTLIERYLRMFHGAVAFATMVGNGASWVGVATAEDCERAGVKPANAWDWLLQELATYGQWADGEVYGVIVNDPATGSEASLWGCFDADDGLPYLASVAGDLAREIDAGSGADKDADDFGDVETGHANVAGIPCPDCNARADDKAGRYLDVLNPRCPTCGV